MVVLIDKSQVSGSDFCPVFLDLSFIPPFRFHSISYHGLFSAAAKDRANACALALSVDDADRSLEV